MKIFIEAVCQWQTASIYVAISSWLCLNKIVNTTTMRQLVATASLIVFAIFLVILVLLLALFSGRRSFVSDTLRVTSSSSQCAINEAGQCVRGRGTFEKVDE